MSRPLPISKDEFARFFKRCVPPTGWSRKIAVANSGGPDSTCLLFLIRRYIQDLHKESPEAFPSSLVSLTIDHALQPDSDVVARRCADQAKVMGVEHVTSQIPWSTPPFPECPKSGEAFEEIGRSARYQLLFQRMNETQAEIVALGHHGDDQVETSLMRLARGSTEIGAGGMRRCRRWGMGLHGDENTLGWAGALGMKRWIIRPLLDVSKDRILASCEEHKLEYITDPTNFQPELTLRNAIRQLISKNSFDPQSLGENVPPYIAQSLDQVQHSIASLESVDMDPSGGLEHLRAAVTVLSEQVEDIDSLVDSSLNRCRLPSPPGTYLVSYRGLATIRDPLVQRALVLRIMRYVSFFAWGTVRADANRRRSSIERIIANLWTPDPFAAGIAPFVAGGGVFWSPVVIGRKSLRIPAGPHPPQMHPGDIIGWLAARQPPLKRARMEEAGIPNPLRVDITDRLRARLEARHQNPGQVLDVLWDCRFLLRMDVDRVPDGIARGVLEGRDRVVVHPHTRWYWPKVLHVRPQRGTGPQAEVVVHSTLSSPESAKGGLVKLDRDMVASWPPAFRRTTGEVSADWIETEWIRSLSAL
ncbi:PP-loop family-domain-containing protein [Mycena pura]|uniref:tRNA(Ile)-lysidine synthetase n=1 Tax=Mycena pura TaxID=153505 RepID=A0AAD6VN08_9AGAR|nr:PP-loop family-domain-containing protein [Mycena pura]